MKRFITLLSLLSLIINLNGQTMISEDKIWTYFIYDTTDPGSIPHALYYTEAFTLGSEVIVDNNSYYEILIPNGYDYETCDIWNYQDTHLLVREDSLGKIYVRDTLDQEILVYDFSLEIGDNFVVGGISNTITLLEKDSLILNDGSKRERFLFDNGEEWIKGIGSTHSFLNVSEYEMDLLCYKENCEFIASTFSQECFIAIVGTKNVSPQETFKIFPNPANSNVEIQFPKIIDTQIELYNLNGEIITAHQVNTQSKINLSLSNISNGIYFLKIENTFKKLIVIN